MAADPKLTLYDLASVGPPFSPNSWQTRLALNYKGLPFKTVWLSFVDIKPTLQRIGATPTPAPVEPDGILYTVPVLVDASISGPPMIITDTLAIAEYLDEKYPERPIFPRSSRALLSLYHQHLIENILLNMAPIVVGAIPAHILDRDQEYFRESRERWLGAKLEDLSPPGPKREEQMARLEGAFDELAKKLARNGDEGVLVMGNQPSVGDFALLAFFIWMKAIKPDVWEVVKQWNEGRWDRLWIMSENWRKNQK